MDLCGWFCAEEERRAVVRVSLRGALRILASGLKLTGRVLSSSLVRPFPSPTTEFFALGFFPRAIRRGVLSCNGEICTHSSTPTRSNSSPDSWLERNSCEALAQLGKLFRAGTAPAARPRQLSMTPEHGFLAVRKFAPAGRGRSRLPRSARYQRSDAHEPLRCRRIRGTRLGCESRRAHCVGFQTAHQTLRWRASRLRHRRPCPGWSSRGRLA